MESFPIAAAGLRLNCLDYGGDANPALLFLHGGSAHAHWWDYTAPNLTDQWHPLAIDQRGHGDSDWSEQWSYGSSHYVEDIHAIVSNWKHGAPVLIGHSMGCHNALLYAATHPDSPRAIVVVDIAPDYSQRAVDFLRTFADKSPRRFASFDEACANFRLLPRETKATPEVLRHLAKFTFKQLDDGSWTHKLDRRTLIREPIDIWPILQNVRCPALIVKVSDSFVLDREVARQMASKMARGTMTEVGNSFHHVMLDNPVAFVKTLREFLSSL